MTDLSILWSITWGSWLTALAIILIRLLFHCVLSSKAKYYLWLLLALRLMLPVLPQSPFSIQNYLPGTSPTAHISASVASAPQISNRSPLCPLLQLCRNKRTF